MMRYLCSLIVVLAAAVSLHAQQTDSTHGVDTTLPPNVYCLKLFVSGGMQFTVFKEPTTAVGNRRSFAMPTFNVRAMWKPEHLLSVGLMSGYTTLARETLTAQDIPQLQGDLHLELDAIPMMMVFAMQQYGVELSVGIGAYYLTSTSTGSRLGDTRSTDFTLGVSLLAGYTYKFSDRFGLGVEAGLHNLSSRGIFGIAPALRLEYDFYTY